jgi:hypothetical protein
MKCCTKNNYHIKEFRFRLKHFIQRKGKYNYLRELGNDQIL